MSVKLQIEYIVNNRKPDGRAQDIPNSTDRAKDFSWMQKKGAIVKIPVNSVKYRELTAASKLCCKSFGAIKDLCSYALSFQHLDQLFSPANHLKLERPRLLL